MNNNFQNPLQVLKAKTEEAWSGCIEIEEPKDASVSWNVYLLQGKIQYINTTKGQQTRLNYLWQKFDLGSNCPLINLKKTSEYTQLCHSLSEKKLTDADIKKLLFFFNREGLTYILSIEQTYIKFIPGKRINKSFISFSLEKLQAKLHDSIKAWREIRSYLPSPFSRLYLEQKNALKFYKVWKTLYASPDLAILAKSQKLSSFVSLFVAKNNLYYIANKSKVDTYLLAKYLQETIDRNLISLLPFKDLTAEEIEQKRSVKTLSESTQTTASKSKKTQQNNLDSSNLIVCIDDSKTVQRQVKMTLQAGGYQVLSILDPSVALKKLSQQQPAVIFMDINMPNINGYDLCSLLRKSQKFKEVPIVMLTGRDGMIDRVRAKIVGATDYLTKPCDPNKLISLARALEKTTAAASISNKQ